MFRYVGSQKLSEMLQQPYDLYKPGWVDGYLMGLINQVNNILKNQSCDNCRDNVTMCSGQKPVDDCIMAILFNVAFIIFVLLLVPEVRTPCRCRETNKLSLAQQ